MKLTKQKWPVYTALLIVGLFALRQIWCTDFWWQWATGKYVWNHGLPEGDVFSYTFKDKSWIEMSWLYCVVLFKTTQVFGYSIVVFLKSILVLTTFCLAYKTRPSKNIILPSFVLILAGFAANQQFSLQPELVTYLFLALYTYILCHIQDKRRSTNLFFVLPVIQLIWTNSHTLFILGPITFGLFWVTETLFLVIKKEKILQLTAWNKMSAALCLTMLACFVNPYGFEGFLLPFQLFTAAGEPTLQAMISETQSPFEYLENPVVWAFLAMSIFSLLALINIRQTNIFILSMVITQFYLATISIRNLPLFILIAIPFILDSWEKISSGNWIKFRRISLCIIAIAQVCLLWLLLTNRFYLLQNDSNQFGAQIHPHRYAHESVAFLKKNQIYDRIFNTILEGALLTANDIGVYIDPRGEVYGNQHISKYANLLTNAKRFERESHFKEIKVLLVGLDSVFHSTISELNQWDLVFFDHVAAVYLKKNHRPDIARLDPTRIHNSVNQILADLPQVKGEQGLFHQVQNGRTHLSLSKFLFNLGYYGEASNYYEVAETVGGLTWQDKLEMAEGFRSVNQNLALRIYKSYLKQFPKSNYVMLVTAELHSLLGEPEASEQLLRKIEAADPSNPEIYNIRGRNRYSQGDIEGAIRQSKRAYDLNSKHLPYVQNLAILYLNQGHSQKALEIYQTAWYETHDVSYGLDFLDLCMKANRMNLAKQALEDLLFVFPEDKSVQGWSETIENFGDRP